MARPPLYLHYIDMSMSQLPSKVTFIEVEADYAGQRIDNFLLTRLKGLPKSRLYNLLRKGEIRVNKKRTKPSYRLSAGDSIRLAPIRLQQKTETFTLDNSLRENLESRILHEDDDYLVIDKPAGMAVHGGSGLSWGLIEAARAMRADCRQLELAHRLDRDTSGCIVLAKRRYALKHFHAALRERSLQKNYIALVDGRWPNTLTEVAEKLEKNVLQSGERMVRASDEGKPSKTLFEVIERFQGLSLLGVKPVTGRTHQIRVHTQCKGMPIVGDPKYGNEEVAKKFKAIGASFMFLHAFSVELPVLERVREDQPKRRVLGKMRMVEAGMPLSWQTAIDQVKNV